MTQATLDIVSGCSITGFGVVAVATIGFVSGFASGVWTTHKARKHTKVKKDSSLKEELLK